MRRLSALGLFSVAFLTAFGGCPANTGDNGNNDNNNDSNSDSTASLAGAWTGQLVCQTTQAINNGAPGAPRQSSRDITISFDASGVFENVVVFGFSGGPDQEAAISRVGDRVVLNAQSGDFDITQTVTVASATYSAGSARVTLDIEYDAVNGNLHQTGTGTQTIEATRTSGGVDYQSDVSYDIDLTTGSVNINTDESQMCSGTLAAE